MPNSPPDGPTITRLPATNGAIGVHRAAVDRVTTRDAERRRIHLGPILPFERIAFARQIECIKDVKERSHDVHRAADHERLSLMATEDAGRKAPHGMEMRYVAG